MTKFPKVINLELTSKCQLHCKFCLNHKRKKDTIGIEILSRLQHELPVSTTVLFCGIGEPTMHPVFNHTVEDFSDVFPHMWLNTNMQNTIMESTIGHFERIMVSMDYMDAVVYKKNKRGDYYKAFKNLAQLFRDRNAQSSSTKIQVNVLMESHGSAFHIAKAADLFRAIMRPGDCIHSRLQRDLCGEVESKIKSDDWKFVEEVKADVKKRLDNKGMEYIHFDNPRELMIATNSEYERKPCGHLTEYCMILADGRVIPCCNDFLGRNSMGNINDNTLAEIWNGKAYRAFRENHNNMLLEAYPICVKCQDWRCRYSTEKEK